MFDFLKKDKDCEVYAPAKGRSLLLEDVKDKVFSNKMMGDGIAFEIEEGTIYAPCDMRVLMIASTKHAIGLKCNNGAELLLHVGLDSVYLNGEGFTVLVKPNMRVKRNEPLIKIDCEFMKQRNIDLTTPLILTNTSEFEVLEKKYGDVDLNSRVMIICKK